LPRQRRAPVRLILPGKMKSVTQPSGNPIIHSTKRGFNLPTSVGGGAGRPKTMLHLRIAASYGPQVGNKEIVVRRSIPPSPCWPAPVESVVLGVGSSFTAIGNGVPAPFPFPCFSLSF
jgi:hypothetical protein